MSEHPDHIQEYKWTVEKLTSSDQDIYYTFNNCFEDGIYVTVYIVSRDFYQEWHQREPYLPANASIKSTDAYVVVTESAHRISGSSMIAVGGYTHMRDARQCAYEQCVDWHTDRTICEE